MEKKLMKFGEAIELLKQGKAIQRIGWNGKGQFVYYVPASKYHAMTDIAKKIMDEDGNVEYNAYLALKTVQGNVSTWVPNITDLFAEDWVEI